MGTGVTGSWSSWTPTATNFTFLTRRTPRKLDQEPLFASPPERRRQPVERIRLAFLGPVQPNRYDLQGEIFGCLPIPCGSKFLKIIKKVRLGTAIGAEIGVT